MPRENAMLPRKIPPIIENNAVDVKWGKHRDFWMHELYG
jgi:hypothetical protein